MNKILTFLIATFIISTSAFSQVVIVNSNCQNAYVDILSLKFDDAQKRINEEKQVNPDNVITDYLENYIDFLKITISEDENLFKEIEDNIQIRSDKIRELSDTSRFKNYFLGNINLQWATVNLRFGNYIAGAFKINRAYRFLEDNDKKFPGFFPNKITLGVLHIMIGIVPDSYHWLLNLISMSGTVAQGRKELTIAYNNCLENTDYAFLKDEILFYMGMVDLNLSPGPEYANYLLSKIDNDNKSLLLSYLAINTRMKNNQNDEALLIFDKIDSTQNYYPFYYLEYLRGDCYLRNLNTEKASASYQIFVKKFTGTNYIKDAWRKIAWCYLIDGDIAGYNQFMDSIPMNGETNIDADKNAENAFQNKNTPSVNLLKARLLSDGGYFKQADSALTEFNPKSDIQKVEKNYRKARIAHQLMNYDDAKKYYKITINTGGSFTEYFAANSALKLGNIYESENRIDEAGHYYKLCLDMDFDEYRNSIRGKAKQGIERIEETY